MSEPDPETGEVEGSTQMFSEWLAQHKNGTLDAELTMMMREATNASRDHQKKADVGVKIKMVPHADTGMMLVSDEISAKIPQATRTQTFYFTTDDGDMVKQDPQQPDLPFGRNVNEPETNVVPINNESDQA